MKKIIQIGSISLSIIFAYSCAGVKKFDFDTAYKFSSYRFIKASTIEKAIPDQVEPQKLTASISRQPKSHEASRVLTFEESLSARIGIESGAAKELSKEQVLDRVSSMSARERRQLRKDVKAELKRLRQEVDLKLDVEQDEQVSEMSDATRLSIIAGSVGIILLILGAIFSVSFLTIVGAIITVGAAILFIVDQV